MGDFQFVTAILIRYGLGAESLSGFFVPDRSFSCIYYPLSTLPEWMRRIAEFLPTTYVFEGMRALLLDGVWRKDLLLQAFGLNLVYLTIGVVTFLFSFRIARKHGLLLQSGE